MKKAFLIFTLFLMAVTFCNAQMQMPKTHPKTDITTDARTVVTVSPFAFITNTFQLGFEEMLSKKASVKAIVSLGLSEHSQLLNVDNYTGFSAEGQLRYFPLKQSPAGFYGAIYLYDRMSTFERSNYFYDYWGNLTGSGIRHYNLNSAGGGVLLGAQIFASKIVAFDFYLGGGPNIPVSAAPKNDYSYVFNPFHKGILPHVGFQMGIALK